MDPIFLSLRPRVAGVGGGKQASTFLYLQFADDTILFSSTRREEVMTLKRILRCFPMVFGLKVNISKSKLVGVGCSQEINQSLAAMIRCKLGSLPFMYLGLSTGAKQNSRSLWYPVIDKVEKKLSSWKKHHLSLGDRITLIRACLSNLLIYFMSLFKMPKEVVNRLDRI